ncbi:hypothetical protein ACQPZF_27105 [Actinosynnema sp. CS-041913]|uniref:hypothetical protein n=1 Tax=Actinosynnema sp. CS-041913 TaxID=3239917 RepID=UPI003D8D9AC4
MVVYTNRNRTDPSPRRASEPEAEFYERVAGPYWDQVREVINEWVSHFPEHSRSGLLSRLLDRNSDANVYSALWELYLHEMLLGSGCTVQVEQSLGSRGKSPDFLVTRDDRQFVIEAIWTAQRIGDMTSGALTPSLIDAIESVPSPNFYLAVSVNQAGSAAPSQKRLKAGLIRWLAALDPDRFLADRDRHDMPLSAHVWREAGWSVSSRAIPRSIENRGLPSNGTIGFYPALAWFDSGSSLVFDAVRKKGKKYGDLSLPFVVAVGNASGFPEERDTERSLYGNLVERDHAGGASTLYRRADGYWTTAHAQGRERVSGVLIVDNPAPWTWTINTPVLWRSPNPNSIEAPTLPTWATVRLVGDQVERQPPAAPGHTAVGLAEQWPLGDAFPRQVD